MINKEGLELKDFAAFSKTSNKSYLFITNLKTGVTRISSTAVEYFGLPGEYINDFGKYWNSLIHPDDFESYFKDVEACKSGKKEKHDIDYRIKNAHGDYVLVTCRGVIVNEKGMPFFAGMIENHGLIDNIDSITNLYNVYEFLHNIKEYQSRRRHYTCMLIGIRDFSQINAIYGYNTGNKVLHKYANILKDIVTDFGNVYRLDGTKFGMILNTKTPAKIEKLYSLIRESAHKDVEIDNKQISFSVAGGYVIVNNFTISEHTVLSTIGQAFEESKRNHSGQLVAFNEKINDNSALELFCEIRKNIVDGCNNFHLKYQPIVDSSTHNIIGMEALLRYKKDGEDVPPNSFIPYLENDPCFYYLGEFILNTALKDCKSLFIINPNFFVNVNISYTQLERSTFRRNVFEIIENHKFPTKNLHFELTERCRIISHSLLSSEVNYFRNNGIQIILDDFGTGNASLDVLLNLNVDGIKLDRSFITNVENDYRKQAIVESIISCANKLNVDVTAEGIEDAKLVDYLKEYHIDKYQGYYFGKPVSINEIRNKLIKQKIIS